MSKLSGYFLICCYSFIKYGIVLGDSTSNSGNICTLQKKIFRMMAGAQNIM
jgi:hypothetical protein